MKVHSSKVLIVVDADFGERVADLPSGVPIWIVSSPANNSVVGRLREQRPHQTHLTGITTFRSSTTALAEDVLIEELTMIDLHHGPYSANQPYDEIEVFGVSATPRLRSKLTSFGFADLDLTDNGFRARRRPE